MSKLYTKQEIVSAIKAKKTAFVLQYIEGRDLKTEIYGKLDSFVMFIAISVANILCLSKVKDVEGVAEEIKSEIIYYYKKGQKEPFEESCHNLKETV